MLAHKWLVIVVAFASSLILGCQDASEKSEAAMKGKPSASVSLRIEPDSDALLPGEIVDFRITAATPVAIPELELKVDVPDSLAVYSGDRKWVGPLPAGARHEIILAIRIPEGAGQRITATAVARFGNGQSMAARDIYVFGQPRGRGDSPAGRHRTTPEGERIREYQLP